MGPLFSSSRLATDQCLEQTLVGHLLRCLSHPLRPTQEHNRLHLLEVDHHLQSSSMIAATSHHIPLLLPWKLTGRLPTVVTTLTHLIVNVRCLRGDLSVITIYFCNTLLPSNTPLQMTRETGDINTTSDGLDLDLQRPRLIIITHVPHSPSKIIRHQVGKRLDLLSPVPHRHSTLLGLIRL